MPFSPTQPTSTQRFFGNLRTKNMTYGLNEKRSFYGTANTLKSALAHALENFDRVRDSRIEKIAKFNYVEAPATPAV